jgi:hypothetical protein
MTYSVDGISIGILLIFYVCTVVALRWTPKTTTVTQYDPPAGVSPALAAYLRDNGKKAELPRKMKMLRYTTDASDAISLKTGAA